MENLYNVEKALNAAATLDQLVTSMEKYPNDPALQDLAKRYIVAHCGISNEGIIGDVFTYVKSLAKRLFDFAMKLTATHRKVYAATVFNAKRVSGIEGFLASVNVDTLLEHRELLLPLTEIKGPSIVTIKDHIRFMRALGDAITGISLHDTQDPYAMSFAIMNSLNAGGQTGIHATMTHAARPTLHVDIKRHSDTETHGSFGPWIDHAVWSEIAQDWAHITFTQGRQCLDHFEQMAKELGAAGDNKDITKDQLVMMKDRFAIMNGLFTYFLEALFAQRIESHIKYGVKLWVDEISKHGAAPTLLNKLRTHMARPQGSKLGLPEY